MQFANAFLVLNDIFRETASDSALVDIFMATRGS